MRARVTRKRVHNVYYYYYYYYERYGYVRDLLLGRRKLSLPGAYVAVAWATLITTLPV